MKKFLLLLPFLLFTLLCSAQDKIPQIDFDTIIKKVRVKANAGAYDEAVQLLDQINKNDSTYCSLLVSKSFYLLTQKKFDAAIAATEEGLQTDCYDLHSSFYINQVVIHIRQENYEAAIRSCDVGLERFPQNKTLLYNKAVAYEGMGKIKEAVALYQHTMAIDPWYRKPYLQLGNIAYRQELMAQALMCFNMYLLLEPDADGAFNTLKSLNNIVQSKNEHTKDPKLELSPDDGAFEDIDLILTNRLALNEGYQTGNEIDVALTKQNHALIESLDGFSANDGFWDRKFVPFYQWVRDQGHFNDFTYTLCYSIENETYKKIVNKKFDEIQSFYESARQRWKAIMANDLVTEGGTQKTLTHYFEDGYLQGIGETKAETLYGPWQLFNQSGRKTADGSFNENGNRDGDWTFYNDKGERSETVVYEDGVLNGPNLVYFPNGRLKISANYANDQLDGEYRYYSDKGALLQRKYFKNGALDGPYRAYHKVGEPLLQTEAEYVAGDIKDTYNEYFATGSPRSVINFSDGQAHGPELKYYSNGAVELDMMSANGEAEGSYKIFHPNGNPKEVGQTSNGNYAGSWKTYYSTGVIESEYSYGDNGTIDGDYHYYDTDGKLNYTFVYRKGELIAYTYFDKDGGIIEQNRKKGGEFYYKGYSPQGALVTEGLYDIKGGKVGEWKYYANGILTDKGTYKDNLLQGAYTSYFPNGDIRAISNYTNDSLQGYSASYFPNGKIKRQGWNKDGRAHGEWISHYPDGGISEVNFFHKDQLHGVQKLFSGNGVLYKTSTYAYGEPVKETYYDAQGQEHFSFTNDNEQTKYEVTYRHYNGKPSVTFNYVNGIRHGAYVSFDFYGTKISEGEYLNGELHGPLKLYHDNGQLKTEANFLNGELDGPFKSYHENGSRQEVYQYANGQLVGEVFDYHENGVLLAKNVYVDGKRHGRREDYDPNGKLQLTRYYDYGRLIGYGYLGTDGEEIPMVPLTNESGRVTTYYDNGKVSREMEYQNGYLINDFKEYYYSGQLYEQATFVEGDYHGKYIEYHENGSLKTEHTYVYDLLHGGSKTYHENGKLKKERTFKNDVQEGPSKEYDANGTLIKEETYFNGEIVSSQSH
ncbi:hypothetical protein ABV409_02285 [Flagellimonas sp. DF-77]|uniref:hypothetical protein n=1 Tax=Flagellimonas algarum TaxID=3230298 RepID=UPI003398B3A2